MTISTLQGKSFRQRIFIIFVITFMISEVFLYLHHSPSDNVMEESSSSAPASPGILRIDA